MSHLKLAATCIPEDETDEAEEATTSAMLEVDDDTVRGAPPAPLPALEVPPEPEPVPFVTT